jgi:exopolysaccharide production protein ExoQ
MTDAALPMAYEGTIARGRATPVFPQIVGFFFIFRVGLTYLFFQGDPVLGTIAGLAINLGLLFCAVLYSLDGSSPIEDAAPLPSPVLWMLTLFAFSAASLCWTGAQSLTAACGYWTTMTTDVAIALLLLRGPNSADGMEALMKGAVWGAVGLAAIAWCSPATEDLRLGNDEFLHPNTLGMEFGITALIAQYLIARGVQWKWLSVALAVTLMRTLSKTAIIAFVVAECWYLMQSRAMTRRSKLQLGAVAMAFVAGFWGLLNTYLAAYNSTGSGNQAETLTGRTVLWTVAFSMSMERPWLGHGFYSFKSLIPALGPFAAVHAHNELLQQFFECGLVGVAIVIALYAAVLRQAWCAPRSEMRTLALALPILAMLRGLADTVPVGLSYPLWLMAALSLCLTRPRRNEVSQR